MHGITLRNNIRVNSKMLNDVQIEWQKFPYLKREFGL